MRTPLPPEAVARCRALLDGGQWVPRILIDEIAKDYHIQNVGIGEGLQAAESDLGAFWCIVTQGTPLEAPDEALFASGGISETTAIHLAVMEWRKAHGMLKPRKHKKKRAVVVQFELGLTG